MMQMAIDQMLWLRARPSVAKRPQPKLDPETYAAASGIGFGVFVGALMWVGIFCVIHGIRG
jgi:hypothetical protein